MSTTDHRAELDEPRSTELSIGGMTCASCAVRIEKKLNKLDGVSASVNYATEKAKVTYSASVDPEELVAAVVATGYTVTPPPAPAAAGGESLEPSTAESDEAA
jgi:Cu+-exporting ATPase